MMGFDPMYMLIIFGSMAASWFVGNMLKSRFHKYSQVGLSSKLSGKEVAERMLQESGIYDVQVISVRGQLTDHYNPQNKTVNLSEVVYSQRNVAAAAVAAHECGHAIQHAKAYPALTMRSRLVPLVSISSKFMQWVIFGGLMLMGAGSVDIGGSIFFVGLVMFGLTTLFAFVTLPVEFDASKRALDWLNSARITSGKEQEQAKDALKWAAMTYVVAALASLGQLMYFILLYLRMRNRGNNRR